jgi:hypothetical protein
MSPLGMEGFIRREERERAALRRRAEIAKQEKEKDERLFAKTMKEVNEEVARMSEAELMEPDPESDATTREAGEVLARILDEQEKADIARKSTLSPDELKAEEEEEQRQQEKDDRVFADLLKKIRGNNP